MTDTDGRPRLLWVTDLGYPARGRRYGDEDVWLTTQLRDEFAIALCHPTDAVALLGDHDGVVVRNSGPLTGHRAAWAAFRELVLARGVPVLNPVTGRGDQRGKQYLVDLWAQGWPVVPTVDRVEDLDLLPPSEQLVVKPKDGADSAGLRFLDPAEVPRALAAADVGELLVQPRVDLVHEVSFTFVDDHLHHALHAPDPDRRWELAPWEVTPGDRAFAAPFVAWNGLGHAVQRVDACRLRDGGLLLLELEDLNPYLSLDRLDEATRASFVTALAASLRALLAGA